MSNYLTTDGLKKNFSTSGGSFWGLRPVAFATSATWLIRHWAYTKTSWRLDAVLFLWRYEPVRRTGKSDDWLTIFFARIIRFTVQKFQLFCVIFCIIIFFIELRHILILWLAKMPNGGHAGFYIDCHRMTVPENILLQQKQWLDVQFRRYARGTDTDRQAHSILCFQSRVPE